MILSPWPKNLDEAVKTCFLTMTNQEKLLLEHTPEENLIMIHFGWAVNMRNEFGMWQGNEDLIESCGVANPDDASMVIVREVWKRLNNGQ
jgi:hypothetical protein